MSSQHQLRPSIGLTNLSNGLLAKRQPEGRGQAMFAQLRDSLDYPMDFVAVRKEQVTDTIVNGDAQEEPFEDDGTLPGMLAESKPLYQKRNRDGKNQWVQEEPSDTFEAAEGKATAKYAFLVRKTISTDDSRKKYDIHSLIVQSPLLKKALGVVLKDYPGITTNLQRLEFRAPFHAFVHRWPQLTAQLHNNEDDITRGHLRCFHDVLYEELKDAISAKNDLAKNGVTTFEFGWTLFEPGLLAFAWEEGKERVYQVQSFQYFIDPRLGRGLAMNGQEVDFDGEHFGVRQECLRIWEFAGTRKITSLAVFPLDFHPAKVELQQRLIERGKLFEKYAGYHFEHYDGVALGYGRCGMIKHTVKSRIIVDCAAHNRFLPNRVVNLSPLGKDLTRSIDQDTPDVPSRDNEIANPVGDVDCLTAPDAINPKATDRPLSNRELLLCVPHVRGYAMKTKTWLWFFVDQISPIKFASNAFASLILPAEQKELIRAFVQSQAKYKDDFDDFIAGKGRGMILLLSGPPGVGKTLSAESVAEDMKVPLYMMSAGDLGIEPSGIEDRLNVVLEMVAKWDAVLLLDEADVFLEARSPHDLERNKMVSIFLRLLEYYEGVLFLTTNRLTNIDDAFHSRIHVSMRYPNLNRDSRRHIWSTFLGANKGISGGDLDELAGVDLNGRQIKNALKTAQMLARSAGERLVSMQNVRTVLAIERQKIWE